MIHTRDHRHRRCCNCGLDIVVKQCNAHRNARSAIRHLRCNLISSHLSIDPKSERQLIKTKFIWISLLINIIFNYVFFLYIHFICLSSLKKPRTEIFFCFKYKKKLFLCYLLLLFESTQYDIVLHIFLYINLSLSNMALFSLSLFSGTDVLCVFFSLLFFSYFQQKDKLLT